MNRWITLIGRAGMVLIAVSLALYLVYLIPQGSSSLPETGVKLLSPEKFDIYITPSTQVLNPQKGFQIIMQSNGTLNLKVYSLSFFYVWGWLNQSAPRAKWNTTLLQEFITTHANNFTREQTIPSGSITFQYFPPKIEEATIIISNLNQTTVQLNYESKTITVIASPQRILLAFMFTAPLGIAFTVLWIATILREKRRKKTAKPTA